MITPCFIEAQLECQRYCSAMVLEHEELTHQIIGVAIEVHRALGPGFLEAIYSQAMGIELVRRDIPFEREVKAPVRYRGVEVGMHRLDLRVAGLIVVELKAVRTIEDVHFAVVRSYLRAVGLRHGLLLNFAKPTLEARRVSARSISQAPPHVLAS